MLRKTLRTLLVGSGCVVMIISGAQASLAQEAPDTFQTLSGRIFWKKSMGVVPKSPGSTEAAENVCAPFYVGVEFNSPTAEPAVAFSNALERGREDPDYYICNYLIKNVPANRNLIVRVGMGKYDPKPGYLPFYYTDPWIGDAGTKIAPPMGMKRSFSRADRTIKIGSKKGTYLSIELL